MKEISFKIYVIINIIYIMKSIKNFNNLSESLKDFMKKEIIDNNNKLECSIYKTTKGY